MTKNFLKRHYWKLRSNILQDKNPQLIKKRLGGLSVVANQHYRNQFTLSTDHEFWLDASYSACLASKTGAFVDVGANTGQTLIKILSIDRAREYIGFEPQIDCAFFIDDFIRQNKLRSHSIIPIGLSNCTGIQALLKRSENIDATASIVEGFRPDQFYTHKQSIFVARGDEVIESIQLADISVVKVDVEGGELEVIEGLMRTLRQHSPFVFFEVLNHFLVASGEQLDAETVAFRNNRNQQLEGMLRSLGYEIFNVLPDNKLKKVGQIRPIVSDDLKITDYIAVHEKFQTSFLNHFTGEISGEK